MLNQYNNRHRQTQHAPTITINARDLYTVGMHPVFFQDRRVIFHKNKQEYGMLAALT